MGWGGGLGWRGGGGVKEGGLFTRYTLLRMIYVHRKGRDWLKMQA